MVIDIKKGEDCADPNYITYFEGKEYKAACAYSNLVYIIDTLKEYRQGTLDSYVNYNGQQNE